MVRRIARNMVRLAMKQQGVKKINKKISDIFRKVRG
jgi:uncharacterized protein YneF (UPF0154 family)